MEELCRQLLDAESVPVLPASMYESEIAHVPSDHFRVGLGRLGLDEGLEAFDRFLRRRSCRHRRWAPLLWRTSFGPASRSGPPRSSSLLRRPQL